MSATVYRRAFFEDGRAGSRRAARVIVPLVLDFIRPTSVVDVGCGTGSWLAVLREFGVSEAVGLDGDYVDRRLLEIPKDQFIPVDLSMPFRLGRTFDLAVCVEVAEHLPPSAAEGFVRSLTQLAPVLLFSAAIPFQGGTNHLNEQWPDYWASLFRLHDFLPIDCIRSRIWNHKDVDYWYVQNPLFFASTTLIHSDPVLRREYERTNLQQLSIVHPRQYLETPGVREAAGLLVRSLRRAARKRMPRLFRSGNNA